MCSAITSSTSRRQRRTHHCTGSIVRSNAASSSAVSRTSSVRLSAAQVDPHLQIGVKAMEILRTNRLDELHSRKLRSFAEVAFQ